jgi:hypothetical protein
LRTKSSFICWLAAVQQIRIDKLPCSRIGKSRRPGLPASELSILAVRARLQRNPWLARGRHTDIERSKKGQLTSNKR